MTKWTKTRRDPGRTYCDAEEAAKLRRDVTRVRELVEMGLGAEPDYVELINKLEPAAAPQPRATCSGMSSSSPMRATRPATRPSHTFFQFRANPFDVLASGFRLLNGDSPADPFITRERGNILPLCSRFWIGNESLSQIRWHFVHHALGDSFFGHDFILFHCILFHCPSRFRGSISAARGVWG